MQHNVGAIRRTLCEVPPELASRVTLIAQASRGRFRVGNRRQINHLRQAERCRGSTLAACAWANGSTSDSLCPSMLGSMQGLSSKVQTCRFLVNKNNVGDGVTLCGDDT